jgi:hypothetical protein
LSVKATFCARATGAAASRLRRTAARESVVLGVFMRNGK